MITVDAVEHSIVFRSLLPEEHSLLAFCRDKLRATIRVNALGYAACAFTDSSQFGAQLLGRSGARLGHINLPLVVKCIRQINTDAREFVVLFLPPTFYT